MRILMLTLTVIFLTACGEGGGDSAANEINLRQACEADSVYVGEWEDEDLEQLDINPDCTARDDYCQASMTYYKPVDGKVLIDIESTGNAAGCLSEGEHTCSIDHGFLSNGTEFITLNCGGGETYYFPR